MLYISDILQVIEKIVDDRLGLGLPIHHYTQDFKGELSFQFYDSVRSSLCFI